MSKHKTAEAVTTSDLIDEAKVADARKVDTADALITSQTNDTDAETDRVAKHQAVYDDLSANGIYLYQDKSVTPVVYYVAAPIQPNDFSMVQIRSS